MSKLLYDICLEEALIDDDGCILNEWNTNLPHWREIREWLPKEWDNCNIPLCMSKELKPHILSMEMKCLIRKKDSKPVARIVITFENGFRLTQRRRDIAWNDLDAQMSDGFGETYDRHHIPNASDGYILQF